MVSYYIYYIIDHLQKLLALEKEIALKNLNKAEVKNDEGLNAQISKSIIKLNNFINIYFLDFS